MAKPDGDDSVQTDDDAGVSPANKGLDQFSRRKLKLFELYENGLITKDVFRCRIDQLLREKREAEKEPATLSTVESRKAHQSRSLRPQGNFREAIDRIVVADGSFRVVSERVPETRGRGGSQSGYLSVKSGP